MIHHVDDIRTALETSPQVREAVAAMLAALGEAWRMDKGDEHDTLEIEFSNQREVADCMEQIAAASKAVDKWIMESRDDDMDAKQTVVVQKAIGATHALVSIANGAEWRAYQQLETDTRRIVTERMAQAILDALQQPPAAPPPADSEQTSKHEAQLQFANDEVKRYEERYRQEHENALALTNTLIRVAPDAYKELKPKLHQNVGEWDKQWSDATRWRRNAQEILWRVSAILEGGDDPEEKAESCSLLVERELDRLKEGNLPLTTEDRQLATIARGIAEHIELHNLPISGDAHFSFIHGFIRYVGDLHEPHPAPLIEALRQLALWKAGEQVAEAGDE